MRISGSSGETVGNCGSVEAGCDGPAALEDVTRYADRPIAFLLEFVRGRFVAHAIVLAAVLAAVGCSVSTQYGIKLLVDSRPRALGEPRVVRIRGLGRIDRGR
jgi:hypothetical protein